MKNLSSLQKHSPTISAGIISANLLSLKSELERLEKTPLKMIHFDVMDGCFAPMLTVGPPFIKAVRTSLIKDIHLMIDNPVDKLTDYVNAGADIITIHAEARGNIKAALKNLGKLENKNDPSRGLLRGIAFNPETPLDILPSLLDDIEIVTLLGLDPTVKGSCPVPLDFIKDKVNALQEKWGETPKLLCIDGGIQENNIHEFAKLGADILVSGSALFKKDQLENNVNSFLEILHSNQPTC